MKHLKTFENEAAFEAAKENLVEPWVVLTEDGNNVHYKSLEPIPYFEGVLPFNVEGASHEIKGKIRNLNKFDPESTTIEFSDGAVCVFHHYWTTTTDNVAEYHSNSFHQALINFDNGDVTVQDLRGMNDLSVIAINVGSK